MVAELRRAGFDFDWQLVDTEPAYLAKLNPDLDLILCDYGMPQFNGFRALELLKKQKELDIPFILVSGTLGEETAVMAMQYGATDYLLKDRIARLGPAVVRALQQVGERREKKRLEAQFIEAQKMEVIGQFAGGVAHDFNNVLAVIMGYSELMTDELPANHALQKYIEEIREAAKRATGLTQQLLIFSRKQAVQAVPLNLNEVIEGMEKMMQQLVDDNIEITLICGRDVGQIKADSGYIWQVLLNMVVNARDAMPNGGKLSIESSALTLTNNDLRSHLGAEPGPYVVLRISDTGVGMTEAVKAHLFEAFFTTKPAGKGTGLGLVTCQNIVRQSGGHIDVSSELDKGTTFRVYFPQIGPHVPLAKGPISKSGPMRRGSETLLVVEDEPSVRHLAEGVLRSHGYSVLTAPNGQDALRVARQHQGPPIALVITDVIMPRMGGKVMAEWLKTSYPDLKVLFTSGYTEEAIERHDALDRDVEFLPKPYTPASLAGKVRDLLDATAG